jgi:hypothetical protein
MPTTLLRNAFQIADTPAASTPDNGAKPADAFTVAGTAGQATTGTGKSAGAGADIVISAGNGGAAPSGSTRGTGGAVTINPGAPGTGTGTGGQYGTVLIATAGGRVGIGTATPTSSLDISGTNLATFTSTRAAASTVAAVFSMRKANTGNTAVANGHELTHFTFSGYDGSAYVSGARIRSVVDGTVSSGVVPTAIAFSTGAGALLNEDGTLGDDNALTERLRMTSAGNIGIGIAAPTSMLQVNGGVQVGVPTGGDKGTGSINIAGDIYKNGTAFTNPDYVFEHHFSGATESAYAGPVPLSQLEDTINAQGQLPGVGREPMGVFGRQDALLEKLEEAYLYIIELTKRVDSLEAKLARTPGQE